VQKKSPECNVKFGVENYGIWTECKEYKPENIFVRLTAFYTFSVFGKPHSAFYWWMTE